MSPPTTVGRDPLWGQESLTFPYLPSASGQDNCKVTDSVSYLPPLLPLERIKCKVTDTFFHTPSLHHHHRTAPFTLHHHFWTGVYAYTVLGIVYLKWTWEPGMAACTYSPNDPAGRGGRITWAQKFKICLGNIPKPPSQKKKKSELELRAQYMKLLLPIMSE